MKYSIVVIFIAILAVLPGRAQSDTTSSVVISILTCAPGNLLYSIYGHNAIRIRDTANGTDLVYNYGTFDFDTPGFALKFMRGKLPYILSLTDFNSFLQEYTYYRRKVTEQVLALDQTQISQILVYLNENMKPENRAYKYDFFMDNCATRLRDILDSNVSGLVWDTTQASGKTFRQIIKEYQKGMPWTDFGIDLIIGSPADKKTTLRQEAFIPDYLASAIRNAKTMKSLSPALQQSEIEVLSFEQNMANSNPLLSPWLFFILLLLVEINLMLRALRGIAQPWIRMYDNMWLILISLSAVLMLFMWFGTDHIPTRDNWNVLWASPLIPVWVWGNRKSKKVSLWIGSFLVACLGLSILNAVPGLTFLPQYFHPLVMVICLILLLKGYRLYRANHV